jgi:hypothetical protein
MTPAQKLSSTFKDKSQFENEIALCGFRLSDGIKEDFKDLQESGEIDESLLRKYKLISSAEHLLKHVELLLDEVGEEINNKVNIVAEVNLKSDFLYSSIQKLSELIKKIEQICQQYPKINLDKLQKKFILLATTLKIQDDKPSNIKISDDLIEEMVGIGKKMRDFHVTKSVLSELLDTESSDIYMNCLFKATIEVTNTIQNVILENKYILSAKFVFSEAPPYLLTREDSPTITEQKRESLSEIITHKKSVDIVRGIKIQYKNIKGKRLKLLLKAFQDLELLPKDRIAKKFHNCCKDEFNWGIGSYNAMNGYRYNEGIDKNDLRSMKEYLETLIKTK